MLVSVFGDNNCLLDPKDGAAADWSPDHVPDSTVFHKAPELGHYCVDLKVVNSVQTKYASLAALARSAAVAFANTGEQYLEKVHGRDEVSRPAGSTSQFNRRNNVGHLDFVKGDYRAACVKGHTPVAFIMNVFGGLHSEGYGFFKMLVKKHSNKLPIAFQGLSWTATTFSSHFSQRLSNAVNMGVAEQIAHVISHWRRPPTKQRTPQRAARPAATAAAVWVLPK